MNGEFTFHSVGQGLMHSGIITKGSTRTFKKFSFIYDCGGKFVRNSTGMAEVNGLARRLEKRGRKRYLDLLILSHFHNDHINGLEYLLRKVTVGTAVIPYVRREELLLAAIRAEGELSDFLIRFYDNPVERLLEAGVQRVIMLTSEEDGAETGPANEEETERLADDGLKTEDPIRTVYTKMKETPAVRNSLTLTSLETDWKFILQNLPVDWNTIDRFRTFLDDTMSKYDHADLSSLVANKKFRDEARLLYEDMFDGDNSINQTSIVAYHAPGDKIFQPIYFITPVVHARISSPCSLAGTLLTGDISLNKETKLDRIDDELGKSYSIGVLQVPHHGSRKNISSWWNQHEYIHSVISYGIGNKYSHPDYETIMHYLARSHIALVNQNNRFSYQIFVSD